jgi:hypothetical protein
LRRKARKFGLRLKCCFVFFHDNEEEIVLSRWGLSFASGKSPSSIKSERMNDEMVDQDDSTVFCIDQFITLQL